MKKLNQAIEEKLTNLLQSMGYEYVGGERQMRGRKVALCLYVDKPGGITVDDCSLVSRQLSAMLDVEDPIQGRYDLEVSSPGIDRPLFTLLHFKQFIGSMIKVKLTVPINQRRQYKGLLTRIDENDQLYLLEEGVSQEVAIPFLAVDKANVVGEVSFKRPK